MRFATTFLIAASLCGCGPDKDRYPPISGCEGTLCNATSPGGGVVGKDGGADGGTGGSGGAAPTATIEQQGTVHLITSPAFDDSGVQYGAAATIHAISGAAGTMSTTPYGGAAGTLFDFKAIPSGSTWFFVEDTTGGASGVISTFSYASLPILPAITLPVIDLGVLQNIASSLPTVAAKGVSLQNAHVIVFVSRAGALYQGAQIAAGSGNAQIAYDSGSGYSDSATSTGPRGTAILFNAAPAGSADIQILDTSTMKTYSLEVMTGPGAATLASIELP